MPETQHHSPDQEQVHVTWMTDEPPKSETVRVHPDFDMSVPKWENAQDTPIEDPDKAEAMARIEDAHRDRLKKLGATLSGFAIGHLESDGKGGWRVAEKEISRADYDTINELHEARIDGTGAVQQMADRWDAAHYTDDLMPREK